MTHVDEKLREVFEQTEDSDQVYDGNFENIGYYKLFCKAASNNTLCKLMGNNLFMFRCTYENKDAIMMVFMVAINNAEDNTGAKNVAERVMEVVEATEKCFVTLDLVKSEEIKEDKFVYITLVKVLNGGV
jgi:hypothetical protein